MTKRLFKLKIIKEWHPVFAQLVIAKDETEARHLDPERRRNSFPANRYQQE